MISLYVDFPEGGGAGGLLSLLPIPLITPHFIKSITHKGICANEKTRDHHKSPVTDAITLSFSSKNLSASSARNLISVERLRFCSTAHKILLLDSSKFTFPRAVWTLIANTNDAVNTSSNSTPSNENPKNTGSRKNASLEPNKDANTDAIRLDTAPENVAWFRLFLRSSFCPASCENAISKAKRVKSSTSCSMNLAPPRLEPRT